MKAKKQIRTYLFALIIASTGILADNLQAEELPVIAQAEIAIQNAFSRIDVLNAKASNYQAINWATPIASNFQFGGDPAQASHQSSSNLWDNTSKLGKNVTGLVTPTEESNY